MVIYLFFFFLFNHSGYSVSTHGVINSSRSWRFFQAENKILSLLVFSDLLCTGKALKTNTHWWTQLGKEMLFIPECLIQIGFKGMFFLWNFASFLPSTWLHLTLFSALNWRGEILIFQGKKKDTTRQNWKVKKEKGWIFPSVIKLH